MFLPSSFTFFSFFLYCYVDHRVLHSFPTRRSSDLNCSGDFLLQLRGDIAHGFEQAIEVKTGFGRGEDHRRIRSEEHTSELQSLRHLVCRLLLEKKKKKK